MDGSIKSERVPQKILKSTMMNEKIMRIGSNISFIKNPINTEADDRDQY